MLNYKLYQQHQSHLIVMLHGFLGSIDSFELAKDKLIPHMDVLLVECPGHGENFDNNEVWSFDHIAKALSLKLASLRSQYDSITLYGYSMGGRIALYTVLHYPEQIDKLILESATPGIEDEALRHSRIEQDERRSKQIETNFEDFIDAWEQLSLFNTFEPLTTTQSLRQRHIRMNHHARGIAKALREYGTGRQQNLWPMLNNFNKPVLLLTGCLDTKFEAIAKRMAEQLPQAAHVIIDAGHTIHVENLKMFDTIIVSFIKEENHD
ncbi:2-succinyl-6-hydroxy-2,4-cyclohexadiene-1-carboxylate synthase [Macrococcus capreoli]|uniref:2-succinyl-6-hydroxy-2, 4-cyclohexadiene-1-carboxylate synthase n=1 Tax=Macrococcus capreoli TaxID=2982690 RepID=UPI0021D5FDF8|nr:2-succinyl-6-hydroxy-2,4-cyclohexadiene-1-carboxylate synthase [Macrococcus sp. TMW 2.2395]MCU7557235.1 2-succinyl-6-hydroxy-2,4-cyclohexadiene-1-carboxylate synthase [Macrococcus sp. TMW 2.2395]